MSRLHLLVAAASLLLCRSAIAAPVFSIGRGSHRHGHGHRGAQQGAAYSQVHALGVSTKNIGVSEKGLNGGFTPRRCSCAAWRSAGLPREAAGGGVGWAGVPRESPAAACVVWRAPSHLPSHSSLLSPRRARR